MVVVETSPTMSVPNIWQGRTVNLLEDIYPLVICYNSYGLNHHAIHGKIHYFDMVMASIAILT